MLEGSVYFLEDFQILLIHVNHLFLVKCHLTAAQYLTHVSTLMFLASGYRRHWHVSVLSQPQHLVQWLQFNQLCLQPRACASIFRLHHNKFQCVDTLANAWLGSFLM